MVDHVKLEIAIQLIAEKISEIYAKIEKAKSDSEKINLDIELDKAYEDKNKITKGDVAVIEQILKERGRK